MEFRIRLDKKLDANLIERITAKANGASKNKALLFLVRHWCEAEVTQNPPESGQKCGRNAAEMPETGGDLDELLSAAMADISTEFE